MSPRRPMRCAACALLLLHGNAAPLPGAAPQVPGDANEFISFTGECPNQAPGLGFGDCAFTITAVRDYQVRADFAVMKQVVFQALGAGTFTVSVRARDVLSMPARPNGVQQSGPGTAFFDYWNCGTAGTGDGPGSGCTKGTP